MNFEIEIELKHEGDHHLKFVYDWLTPAGEDFSISKIETAPLKEFQLLQIEGELPVPEEPPVVEAPLAKGKKDAKQPAKGGSKQAAVEEIKDDRPRTVVYKRDCAEENGGCGFRITEPCAIRFVDTEFNL